MSSKFQPLRISWNLATDLVLGGNPIHLDALVAYAKTKMELNLRGLDTNSTDTTLIRDLANDLPLAKETRGDQWVYQASAIMPAEGAEVIHGMRYWTRRTNEIDYAERVHSGEMESASIIAKRLAGKVIPTPKAMKPYSHVIDTVRGLHKNIYKFYPTKTVQTIHAWCIGDRDQLQELLDPSAGYILSIGPRKRNGHGLISSFDIVEDKAALELWDNRVLPWMHEGAEPMELAAHPPYWAPENRGINFARKHIFF